jgi:hypothetical protein
MLDRLSMPSRPLASNLMTRVGQLRPHRQDLGITIRVC